MLGWLDSFKITDRKLPTFGNWEISLFSQATLTGLMTLFQPDSYLSKPQLYEQTVRMRNVGVPTTC